jgi:hypothetical protein
MVNEKTIFVPIMAVLLALMASEVMTESGVGNFGNDNSRVFRQYHAPGRNMMLRGYNYPTVDETDRDIMVIFTILFLNCRCPQSPKC